MLQGNAHYVDGRTTKEENPHWHRMARSNGFSPYVTAWLDKLPPEPMSAEDAELAARLALLPEPAWLRPMEEYQTRGQRMSAFLAAADRANKKRPPLIWRPIEKERAERLAKCSCGAVRCKAPRNWRHHAEWNAASCEASSTTARKRGDVICETYDDYCAAILAQWQPVHLVAAQ